MKTIKKRFQKFILNRKISALRRELFFSEPYDVSYVGAYLFGSGIRFTPTTTRAYPASEQTAIIRTSLNALIEQRDSLH